MEDRILRLPEVMALTDLSRSTMYLRVEEGTFPKQINLGSRAVGWLDSDVQNWLCDRFSASRKEVA